MLKAIARFGFWLWVAAVKTILKLSLKCLVALAKDQADPPIPQAHCHPKNDKYSRRTSCSSSSSPINQFEPMPGGTAAPLSSQGLIQSFIQEVRARIRAVLGLGMVPNPGLDYHISSIHGSRGASSALPTDAEKYCQTEDKSVYRTLKMRYRSSLKKRKEQIIPAGASRPSSPEGTDTLTEHQRLPAASWMTSTKQAMESPSLVGVVPNRTLSHHSRVRTTSEISELEDKVMPLPVIKTRARRWKSCSNMTSLTTASCPTSPPSVPRRRYHSAAPNLSQGTPMERLKLAKGGGEATFFPNSRNLNGPWPLAISSSHFSEEKRRSLLRLRRQGRQLSDPSGNRIFQRQSANGTVFERRPALGVKRRRSHEDSLMVAAAVAANSTNFCCCLSSSSSSSSSTSSPSSSPPTSSSSCCTTSSSASSSSSCSSLACATSTRKTYFVVNKSSKFLVEQQVIKSAQRGP
ncbi:uncharacterized protein DDB_G0271670-like [Tigriopus californicus]|uniref:uncharacterized protein DDB_G0271670-like n=1 Tax=Tigriopus californicus TaxID=6832 RepID=UPI0027DA77A4|nr:uncharacterized protein DDB_G0271670-like [Tigriopus californicus]